eukprot:6485729-Amphidinium_carterae.2
MQQILIQQSDGKDVDCSPLHENLVPSLPQILDSLPVDAFSDACTPPPCSDGDFITVLGKGAKKRLKRRRDSLLFTPPNDVTFERTWAQVFAAAGQADMGLVRTVSSLQQ